jgi:uncharacterized protein YggT (Ycf19 family)
MTWTVRNALVYALDLIMGVISFFIGFRFLFKLVGANSQTPFVSWIYQVSETLIYPFRGIVPNANMGRGEFDFVALIALLAYAVLLYVATAVIDVALRPRSIYHGDHEHVV